MQRTTFNEQKTEKSFMFNFPIQLNQIIMSVIYAKNFRDGYT